MKEITISPKIFRKLFDVASGECVRILSAWKPFLSPILLSPFLYTLAPAPRHELPKGYRPMGTPRRDPVNFNANLI